MTANVVSTISAEASDVAAALNEARPLTDAEIRGLADFLEDKSGETEVNAVLAKISLERIEELFTGGHQDVPRICAAITRWAESGTFDFNFCDTLAVRLRLIATLAPYDVKAEAMWALLELGFTHNRWYVERIFGSLCGPDMEEGLAKRLAVEFRADAVRVCQRITSWEASISVERTSLHPILAQTLEQICK